MKLKVILPLLFVFLWTSCSAEQLDTNKFVASNQNATGNTTSDGDQTFDRFDPNFDPDFDPDHTDSDFDPNIEGSVDSGSNSNNNNNDDVNDNMEDLRIVMGPEVEIVVLRLNGSETIEESCNNTCTVELEKGTEVELTATLKSHSSGLSYKNYAIGSWQGGCGNLQLSNRRCDITLNSSKEVELELHEDSRYTQTGSGIEGVLDIAPILYSTGVLRDPGLPDNCDTSSSGGVCNRRSYMKDTAQTRAQICSYLVPGSQSQTHVSVIPSRAGWHGYYNLAIENWNGYSWDRLCSHGTDCYNRGDRYLTSITCRKSL